MATMQEVRPVSRYLTKMYVSLLLIFVVFILPWILLALIPELGCVYLLIFVVANALWLVPTLILLPLYYRSLRYEIGEDDITVEKGIFTRSVKTIPYRTITDLAVKRDILDRWLFGLGSLDIQTAGQSAQTGADVTLVGLTNWAALRNEVLARIRAYRASTGIGTEVEPSAAHAPEQLLLREILEELRGLRRDLKR